MLNKLNVLALGANSVREPSTHRTRGSERCAAAPWGRMEIWPDDEASHSVVWPQLPGAAYLGSIASNNVGSSSKPELCADTSGKSAIGPPSGLWAHVSDPASGCAPLPYTLCVSFCPFHLCHGSEPVRSSGARAALSGTRAAHERSACRTQAPHERHVGDAGP